MTNFEDERWFQSLCQSLREDDPDVDFVVVNKPYLLTNERAIELGRSLKSNGSVTRLKFFVDGMTLAGTRGIARFVSSSENLEDLDFRSSEIDHVTLAKIDRFLVAASMSRSIRCLRISPPFGAHALASCLSSLRSSLVTFEMAGPPRRHRVPGPVQPEETRDDGTLVGEAINSLSQLKVLKLQLTDRHFAPECLQQLTGNFQSLRQFLLVTNWLPATEGRLVTAIQNALAAFNGLRSLCIKFGTDGNPSEDNISTLLGSVEQLPVLRSLQFIAHPRVGDTGLSSMAQLIRNKMTLEKLTVECRSLSNVCTILEAAGSSSSLKELTIRGTYFTDEELFSPDNQRLGALIAGLNTVEILSWDQEGIFPETNRLPEDFLRGFEQNRSLEDVQFPWLEDYCDADKLILFNTTRNYFQPLLATSSKVEYLRTAEELLREHEDPWTGLSVVYETLRARDDWFDKLTAIAATTPQRDNPENPRKKQRV